MTHALSFALHALSLPAGFLLGVICERRRLSLMHARTPRAPNP